MGIIYSNKEISKKEIECGGSFNVRLSLSAEPDIVSNPCDIVMILDRSGSMAGSPIANLKKGAKKFIEIIDESTDDSQDGHIGNGSRIGIVSFSSSATKDTGLITSVDELNTAVNALHANGSTNHADSFSKALSLFDPSSANAKIIVMFTDGKTTAGVDPAPIAAAAKSQGVIIYCIGLLGNTGLDENALKDWASDPDSAYVAITPDDTELEKIFEELAKNISKPGATDIVVRDTVNSCFKITSVPTPSKGSASLISPTEVEWKIDKLGVKSSEGAVLEFTVEHIGPCSGEIEVNKSVVYSDKEGNSVKFPSPKIEVDCGSDVTEPCPNPVSFTISGCTDTFEFNAGDLVIESLGTILEIDVKLKHICPHRRVALAVILNEVDEHGDEFKRGFKTLLIPAHSGRSCSDILVRCIKFVLPEELDVSGGTSGASCNERKFKARFIANYIDNDFVCCNAVI